MSTLAFDTHKFTKRLTAVGMPLEQAEILAGEQTQLIGERLAGKQDLESLEIRLTLKPGTLRAASMGVVAAPVKVIH